METLVDEKVKEIKESAEKLRASEKHLRETLGNMMEGCQIIGYDWRYLYVNDAAAKHGRMPKEKLLGKTMMEAYPGIEKTVLFSKLQRCMQQRAPILMENEFAYSDGEKGWFELRGQPASEGIFVLSIDITERKKMENELKLEREKLEAVTENIGAGLAIISKDYGILWANSFLGQFFHDCEGKKCYSTFNKLNTICPDCGVRKVFENGMSLDRHEYSTKGPAGNPIWVELIVTPIKDKDGIITAALELSVDITEKKLLQNKLKEYSGKLEQLVAKRNEELKQTQAKLLKAEKLATIGELAGLVGHDLRNPLTGIKSAAYYLETKHGAEIGDTGKRMLKTIDKAIAHANKIIND